jgi:drug/metabolite transporter (DMT)-like permease
MLASAPVFAASFIITKVLTRSEKASVIVVWQAIAVSLFNLPMGLWTWQPPSATLWVARREHLRATEIAEAGL